jgi:hypothetical protein
MPEAATAGSRFPSARANREPSGRGAGTRGEGPLEELEWNITVGLPRQTPTDLCDPGVTMVPAALSAREDSEWVCLECEELDRAE